MSGIDHPTGRPSLVNGLIWFVAGLAALGVHAGAAALMLREAPVEVGDNQPPPPS